MLSLLVKAIEIKFTMNNKFNMKFFKSFKNAFSNGSKVMFISDEKVIVMKQKESYPLRSGIKIIKLSKVINLDLNFFFIVTVFLTLNIH